jgi:hypothetical protein
MIWLGHGGIFSMTIATVITVSLSYVVIGKLVFGARLTRANGLSFLLMQSFGYTMNIAILYILGISGIQGYMSGVISLGVVAMFTFIIGKFFVFNSDSERLSRIIKRGDWVGSFKSINIGIHILLVFIAFRALYYYYIERYYTQAGDSAGFVDLVRVVAETGGMVSAIFSSAYSIFPLLASGSESYCQSELVNHFEHISFTEWHPYLIAYLIALPVKLFGIGSLQVSSFVNALNVVGALSVIWLYLRVNNVNRLSAISFMLALSIFPVWGEAIDGQFYFDRLYALPCIILILFIVNNKAGRQGASLPLTLVLFLLCLSISERTALLTSIYFLMVWLLQYHKLLDRRNLLNLGLAIVGLIYVFAYMRYFQNSLYYNSISLAQAIENIKQSLLPEGRLFYPTMKWLIVLFPMLLLCSVVPKNLFIVLALITPNLLVSVGGAEKTGFSTHYHAGYLPFIIAYAAIGFAKATEVISRSLDRHKKYTLLGFDLNWLHQIVSIVILFSIIAIGATWTPAGFDAASTRHLFATYESIFVNNNARHVLASRGAALRETASVVPGFSGVSAPEFVMPALVSNGNAAVDYFPIGLGYRPYIIVHYSNPSKDDEPDIFSFLDSKEKHKISQCVQYRLDELYDKVRKINLDGASYIVYRKKMI